MTFRLVDMPWPDRGIPPAPAPHGRAALLARLARVQVRMAAAGFDVLLVHGDREHPGNLHRLTGFDPRFEEALLVLGLEGAPLLLAGNEGMAYLAASPLFPEHLRAERFQPFSLLSQPRGESRDLRAILAAEGIGGASRVGIVGWKHEAAADWHAAPAFLVDAARGLAGSVRDATALFMNPRDGVRAISGAREIALAEHANAVAAAALRAVVGRLSPGITDHEALGAAFLPGLPLSCHPTFAAGPAAPLGLTSPRGVVLARGMPLSLNIGVWRANVCRAGWIAEGEADLPEAARDYLAAFAVPYVAAMAEWFAALRLGTPGGAIQMLVDRMLPAGTFGVTLNPGHLIDIEEWVSSPVYPGSEVPLASGMILQSDVIPVSPRWFSCRMEDGVALADAELRAEIAWTWPGVAERIAARRAFMEGLLGIDLPPEVLPLSDLCGVVAPFLLAPGRVLARG